MDLFAKAVKSGIAKGYAIGKQELQQHLAKQRESSSQPEYDNTSGDHGAHHTAPYPNFPQQPQQQQQTYAAVYSEESPPLPPRQYQPPQPQQPNYVAQRLSQNLSANYECTAPARPEYSYSSIMPPPPPFENVALVSAQFPLQPSHEIPACNRPVNVSLIPTTESFHGQEQIHAREDSEVFVLNNETGRVVLVQNQPPEESYLHNVLPPTAPVDDTRTQQDAPCEQTAVSAPIIMAPQAANTKDETAADRNLESSVSTGSVEQQMSRLNLGAHPRPPVAEPEGRQKPKKYAELPPIQENGPGREIVRFCPEDRLVDYPLYWYYLADLPNSPICTRCYADHIESTPLAAKFSRLLAEADTVLSCQFRYSRVQNIIWPAALKTHSIDDLQAFLSSRLRIPNCKARAFTTGSDGIKYYGMIDDGIPGFIACEACFEDRIAGTSFEAQFQPYPTEQGKNDTWVCDVSIVYVQKALVKFSERNDWHGFVKGATRRFKLAACEGKEQARADSGNWYTTRQSIDNFQVCEACYMDKIELDLFSGEFEQLPGSVDFDQYIEFLRQRWTCSLTSSSLPMIFALDAAENKQDFAAFHTSAAAIAKLVPCTKYGIVRGNWWTITGTDKNFDLCEACYEGIMKPDGLDKFLEPKQHGPEETIVCDFCPAAPRFGEYLKKFAETLDRGIFSCYADYIRDFAGVTACPGRESLDKSKWWGFGEALFCEDCYLQFVRHTSLSDHMPLQGEYDERAQICQIWSPRMRNMWRAICDAGAPGSAESDAELLKFRAFGTKRLAVWLQTVPRILFIRGMKDIKMMQAMQQGQLSLMYSGMNSMAAISGTDDGSRYGNSSLGWYETENGATGAQMFQNMQTGMADANRGDEWMQIFQLELAWKEVE
ncbi:integral membrane protein [Akanthomyces lecanii RCEF 1005]|uniref:Integral membrane protein n=1 Tax=Akanthomyces lecanii RCEF 1005 TaxID=1081108 RepID=A0A168FIS1_CORDF|nr:integral membrane protein [Akanthomyces lecanii RCEF 1005]